VSYQLVHAGDILPNSRRFSRLFLLLLDVNWGVMTPFCWDTTRVLVMGVLNVTPDSFSDGGRYLDVEPAVERARQMATAGADIIDVGGQSTRPGAEPVSEEEELRRVLPVIERLAVAPHPDPLSISGEREVQRTGEGWVISIDTTKAVVAARALAAGARIVNDVSALRSDTGMADVVREHGAGVVLMHMQGTPATMQQNPSYRDVVAEVRGFLAERIEFAVARGIQKTQMAVDPGIGFGKTVEHNIELLARLQEFRSLGCPVLVGASRKSFIGKLLNRQPHERLAGSLAVAAWAVLRGANILRVHDVTETLDVAKICAALHAARNAANSRRIPPPLMECAIE
jgi:dihydropteroate synthase